MCNITNSNFARTNFYPDGGWASETSPLSTISSRLGSVNRVPAEHGHLK